MKIEKYNKGGEWSFCYGAFPTFELIKNKPECAVKVFLHSKLNKSEEIDNLITLCNKKGVPVEYDDKAINKVADKENIFVVGVFKKYAGNFTSGNNLVLVNPSDAGNLGTIMRTSLGFGVKNLVIVHPAVDHFNPKVVRASMGAIFSLNIAEFESLEDYLKTANQKYFFMLNGRQILGKHTIPSGNYDLVFGNEAHGLPNVCLEKGNSILIKHSKDIDSLNLPISVGIALFEFNRNKF